jgi:uncharacterized protein involved in response to NO
MNRSVHGVSSPVSASAGRGPAALLSLGFRPFFLAAGAFAVVAMGGWTAAYALGLTLQNYYSPVVWHGHEMLFGYTAAVIAGFLLTAVRNWTSLPTANGKTLGLLVVLWLLGRVLPLLPWPVPPVMVAILDVAFLPILAASLLVPLVRSGQRRNLVFVPVLLMMTLANMAVHAEQLGFVDGTALPGLTATIYLAMLLMALIGGRVIPFFTARALPGTQPRQQPWLDGLALASLALLAVCSVGGASRGLVGLIAACSAAAHLARLLGWYSHRIWSQPLLWVLHVGYAWLATGLGLTALAGAGLVPANAPTHAFTAGAIGVMTLGMMARVSLGHTGRPLVPAPLTSAAFAVINLAAVFRVLLPLVVPASQQVWIITGGVLWCLTYLGFMASFAPILYRPRADTADL